MSENKNGCKFCRKRVSMNKKSMNKKIYKITILPFTIIISYVHNKKIVHIRESTCVQYKLWRTCEQKKLGRMTQKYFCRYGKNVHFRIDGPMITRPFNNKKISKKNI